MNNRRTLIISYDISNDKTRKKAFKTLKDWRYDGQKSVHECKLTMNQAEELFLQLNEPLNQESDKLMMVWLDSHRNILYRGCGKANLKNNVWV